MQILDFRTPKGKPKYIVNIWAYRYWYAKIFWRVVFPRFEFSRNVQGWYFTRTFTVSWIGYAIRFDFTTVNYWELERHIAHEKNVDKYIRRAT